MQEKIFLKGHGTVKPAEAQAEEKENDENEGIDMGTDKEPEFQQDAVSYGAGVERSSLSDLVEDEGAEEVAIATERTIDRGVDQIREAENNIVVNRMVLPKSNDPGFDASSVQDMRKDATVEGGVTNPTRSTGPMKFNGDAALEGGIIRREPLADSTPGAYELSGFHVEVKSDSGMSSVQITQDFKELAVAMASINVDKYLMPVQPCGFIPCRITRGAPIICFEERQILEYINGAWKRP